MIKQYTTILIDMYGVILEQSKGCLLKYCKDNCTVERYAEIDKRILEERLFDKAGLGEIDSDEFMSLLGFDDLKFHTESYLKNYLTLDPAFVRFAEAVKDKYDLVLLSNDVSEWSRFIVEHHGIDKYFMHRTVSAEVGCRKPDLKIYDLTLEAIGRSPAECLFIDNNVDNLIAAEEVGISPILFNRDGLEFCGMTVESFDELLSLIG